MTFARSLLIPTAAILALSLAACAPEPMLGNNDKHSESEQQSESSWGESSDQDYVPTTELPESFPLDLFVLPDDLRITDAGERGPDQWFLVVLVDGDQAADALWKQIIENNGLTSHDEIETSEGGLSATLLSAGLTVQALTIPQSDGSVQLNYDLTLLALPAEARAEG